MMNKMMAMTLATGVLLFSAATPTVADDDKGVFEQSLAAAKAAQKKAASVGGEWRDVGQLLKDAEKTAASGDYAAATHLASEAKGQSELGYEQAIQQKSAKMEDYLK